MATPQTKKDDDDDDEGDELQLLSPLVPVYVAMLGATIVGQIAGIGLDTLLGIGSIGVPIGCSIAFESAVGARLGAAKSGGSLTPRQALSIDLTYSGALLVVTLPLLAWMEAAHMANGTGATWTWPRLGLALVLFAVATAARWGLMVVIAPRPRP